MSIHKKIIATREKHYNKTLQFILLILLVTFVGQEFKELLRPGKIHIENYAAEVNLQGIDPKPEDAHAEVVYSQTGAEISPLEDISEMIRQTFPEDSHTAIALFQKESGLNPDCDSTTDIMADGRPFSVGLAQINLTQHKIGSVECYKAFRGKNYHAVVIDEGLYSKCVKMAKTPQLALEKARQIYEGRNNTWNAWGAYKYL